MQNNFYIARVVDGKQVGVSIPAADYDPKAGPDQFLPKDAPADPPTDGDK